MEKIITYAIVFVILGGLIGYFLGSFTKSQNEEELFAVNEADLQDCQSELDRYKKAIDTVFPPSPEEVFSIGGEIKSIDYNLIVIETMSLDERYLPGEEQKMEERRINIGSNTKIFKWSMPVFQELKDNEILPEPKETSIKLTDLKAGDFIGVEASENIKTKKEFTATKIIMT